MHELSIAEELIKIIEDTAKKNNLSKVERVYLRIGEMRGVVPDSLIFAFEIAGRGTLAEGAIVEILTVKTKAMCNECKIKFDVEDYNFLCPKCSSVNVVVIEGKELIIDSLEGE